jgi:hypothetical protein
VVNVHGHANNPIVIRVVVGGKVSAGWRVWKTFAGERIELGDVHGLGRQVQSCRGDLDEIAELVSIVLKTLVAVLSPSCPEPIRIVTRAERVQAARRPFIRLVHFGSRTVGVNGIAVYVGTVT